MNVIELYTKKAKMENFVIYILPQLKKEKKTLNFPYKKHNYTPIVNLKLVRLTKLWHNWNSQTWLVHL